ncbi:hypothetical protein ASG92_22325 [Arthrobacter sp. Soil736]|uniref:hypothetical protein n=1 Tax=Arthrobacter sp. Soil736 TaxID=1736395 RepID=UPI0006F7C837|nr:hypothetical protein [Arthrobacter sp. Soil736]KRE60022.1 hypothetical protein ASG92_22325 [Arthrobacter sp. Soil736]
MLSNELITAIAAPIATVLVAMLALVSALLGAAIASRAKIDDALRARRLETYPKLWAHTATASRWPQNNLSVLQISAFHRALREWYYADGGMYLSHRARQRYGDMQEVNAALLRGRDNHSTQGLCEAEYQALMTVCSSMRTAMTFDLNTRKTQPLLRIGQWGTQTVSYTKTWFSNRKPRKLAEALADARIQESVAPEHGAAT